MVQQEGHQLGFILWLQQIRKGTIRESSKGIVAWRENCEWTWARQGGAQVSRCHSSHQRAEGRGSNGLLNNILVQDHGVDDVDHSVRCKLICSCDLCTVHCHLRPLLDDQVRIRQLGCRGLACSQIPC